MSTRFNVLVDNWEDEDLPLSYRYKATENKLRPLDVLDLSEGYVLKKGLRARTLPYFDALGTVVVVSIRDALGAAVSCTAPKAKLPQGCSLIKLKPPREKNLKKIDNAVKRLQKLTAGGKKVSQEIVLAKLHSEILQLNALGKSKSSKTKNEKHKKPSSKKRSIVRAEMLEVIGQVATNHSSGGKSSASNAVDMALPLLSQVKSIVHTRDVVQTGPLAQDALSVTESLLASRPPQAETSDVRRENSAVGRNVVEILSSLSNVVVKQSNGKNDTEKLRRRLTGVVDTLCHAMTDREVPDSIGTRSATGRMDVSCQNKVLTQRRQAIRTRKQARGPSLNVEWKRSTPQDSAELTSFVATVFQAEPEIVLPNEEAVNSGRRLQALASTSGQSKLTQMRLQMGKPPPASTATLQQEDALRLTLVVKQALDLTSAAKHCAIRGPVGFITHGAVYGGANSTSPLNSVLHSVFLDPHALKLSKFYKTEQPLSVLQESSGVPTLTGETRRFLFDKRSGTASVTCTERRARKLVDSNEIDLINDVQHLDEYQNRPFALFVLTSFVLFWSLVMAFAIIRAYLDRDEFMDLQTHLFMSTGSLSYQSQLLSESGLTASPLTKKNFWRKFSHAFCTEHVVVRELILCPWIGLESMSPNLHPIPCHVQYHTPVRNQPS